MKLADASHKPSQIGLFVPGRLPSSVVPSLSNQSAFKTGFASSPANFGGGASLFVAKYSNGTENGLKSRRGVKLPCGFESHLGYDINFATTAAILHGFPSAVVASFLGGNQKRNEGPVMGENFRRPPSLRSCPAQSHPVPFPRGAGASFRLSPCK